MSSNRVKRLVQSLNVAQRNQYYAALSHYRDRHGQPDDKVKLYMLERILIGNDPLIGIEKHT